MGAFQGGMTLLGWMLSIRFSHFIRDFDHWIAFLLAMMSAGIKIFVFRKASPTPTAKASMLVATPRVSRVRSEREVRQDSSE